MRSLIQWLQEGIRWLARRWHPLAVAIIGLIWAGAWLAPILMATGFSEAGEQIHRLLAPHDHQLPQRSYFLFARPNPGDTVWLTTYTEAELEVAGADPQNWRAFIGNEQLGYKTALNFRMFAIFSGLLAGGLLWPLLRNRLSPAYATLMLLPMLLDAISHISSEQGSGYRAENRWAQVLTAGLLPQAFYIGTTLGSLNWWLRSLTGLIFGLGAVYLLFWYLDLQFSDILRQLEQRQLRRQNRE